MQPAEGDICSACGEGKYRWYYWYYGHQRDAAGSLRFADQPPGTYLECNSCLHRPAIITEEMVAKKEALERAIWKK